MLTAAREFTLLGQPYRPGQVIPEGTWLAVPEQNRRAMVRTRFVRSPELTPSRAELRARRTASPVVGSPATPVVGVKECDVCHATFTSASALGGHKRGHAKRGER